MNMSRDTRKLEENAEPVRRAVPVEERAERTRAVYATAAYILEHPTWMAEIPGVFRAIAWTLTAGFSPGDDQGDSR